MKTKTILIIGGLGLATVAGLYFYKKSKIKTIVAVNDNQAEPATVPQTGGVKPTTVPQTGGVKPAKSPFDLATPPLISLLSPTEQAIQLGGVVTTPAPVLQTFNPVTTAPVKTAGGGGTIDAGVVQLPASSNFITRATTRAKTLALDANLLM